MTYNGPEGRELLALRRCIDQAQPMQKTAMVWMARKIGPEGLAELDRALKAKVLNTRLEELELSVLAQHRLQEAGISTVAELVAKTEYGLLHSPGFGRRTIRELKDILAGMNLSLGMDIEDVGVEKAAAMEELKGVFMDIGRTLVVCGTLRPELYKILLDAAGAGRPVVIFTGGDTDSATEELRQLGVDERFLPVRSKYDFRGKLLEEVYDDNLPENQHFSATIYHIVKVSMHGGKILSGIVDKNE